MSTLNASSVRRYTHFPKSGDALDSLDIKEANLDLESNTWFVIFNGKVTRSLARKAMQHFVNKPKHIPVGKWGKKHICVELTCDEVSTIRANPNGRVTIAKGHLFYPYARGNPTTAADFKDEMHGMVITSPEKKFTIHNYKKMNDSDCLDKMWSFVTWSGESYGWVTSNNKLFHRRASIIMPRIKINKRPGNEIAFYHTHPSKDEPSLTSADDFQFFLDLSFEPGIKHHYTIMKDRIDYFKFNVHKPNIYPVEHDSKISY